jgi:hypothetical protein
VATLIQQVFFFAADRKARSNDVTGTPSGEKYSFTINQYQLN